MSTLIISHLNDSQPPRFEVQRLEDGELKRSAPVEITPPDGFPVDGSGNVELMGETRWYLEQFLDYPFAPATERAERAMAALKQWGQVAFEALFKTAPSVLWYDAALQQGAQNFQLFVSSDNPLIMAWPWEALHDPQRGFLALQCNLERKLNTVPDPLPQPDLPKDRVNVLLVVARPFENDVQYRTIARPLVDLIDSHPLPAEVTVLRPPTFDRLREHLRERPGYYHILHFDGHGAYGTLSVPGGGGPYTMQAPQGHLVFEKDDGQPDPIDGDTLSQLLREFRIPAVVLNACQSARVDARAEGPFASVATSLLRAGVRSVVAMAYSLYVGGAQKLLPAFYRRLFETGQLTEANRAGRQEMFRDPGRVCARGTFPLSDWLVPVVYQQRPLDFSFATKVPKTAAQSVSDRLPTEARDDANPYGFVGRDGAILELERAMRRPPAGILVHGLGGVGKTTLARGFVRWLEQTGGLTAGCLWLTFNDIRTGEYVLNTIGTALFGPDFLTLELRKKVDGLAGVLKTQPYVLVWDNFESASGNKEVGIEPLLSEEDRALLRGFLERLRGGKTKIVITSRSEEEWLGLTNRWKLPLGGLRGEERWAFCGAILRDLGKTVDRNDAGLVELMETLEGHPLMMRAVLPMLESRTSASIVAAIRTNIEALDLEDDAVGAKVRATLRFVEQSLPVDLQPLVVPLALHERHADADSLEQMAERAGLSVTRSEIDRFFAALCVAGLVREMGPSIYELHPALTGFLRSHPLEAPTAEAWTRGFVEVMSSLADTLTPKELHEQRFGFHVHGANFHCALREAERLGMDQDIGALLQSLAAYALNVRDFSTAERLYGRLASLWARTGDPGEAGAHHQLGMVAQERRDFDQAEKWYLKSLAISEKHGNEHGAALTYHQLGIVAQKRRDFDQAEKWYLKSLSISEKHGNEHVSAITYHQLGIVAGERRDLDQAEKWYLKSLAIEEKLGDEHVSASTYHQLGMVAQKRRDLDQAEKWYLKSLAISEKHGNEHGAASTYGQLGRVAEERRDFDRAEKWYLKSLAISEKLGDEHVSASTYHQLGMVAQERRDLDQAEKWYLKSLAIKEKLGDEHVSASTYHQLGILAGLRERWSESGQWLIKCIVTFQATRDSASVGQATQNFVVLYRKAPPAEQTKLKALWEAAASSPDSAAL